MYISRVDYRTCTMSSKHLSCAGLYFDPNKWYLFCQNSLSRKTSAERESVCSSTAPLLHFTTAWSPTTGGLVTNATLLHKLSQKGQVDQCTDACAFSRVHSALEEALELVYSEPKKTLAVDMDATVRLGVLCIRSETTRLSNRALRHDYESFINPFADTSGGHTHG